MKSELQRASHACVLAIALATLGPVSQAGEAMDEIRATKSVNVGTEAASYPFEFIRDGKIVGYNKEILDLIVQSQGWKLEQRDVPFAGLLTGLTQKKYHFIASNLFVTPERAERFAFTMPTAAVDMAIAKRKGDPRIKSVNEMSGLIVGVVVPPSMAYVAFQQHNEQLKPKGQHATDVRSFQSSPEMWVALANKQVDVVSLHVPGILGAMQRLPDTYEILGRFGQSYWTGWVTRPEDSDLRNLLSEEIRKLRDKGVLAELQKKWFGYVMEIPNTGYLPPGAK